MKLIIEETNLIPQYRIENISPKGEVLLFDIETTGLKKETTQIYLIGCGYFNAAGNFEVRQWLAENTLDERDVLEAFIEFSEAFNTLIHFNGDGFDIPYVAYKADYYGFDFSFDRFESIDIYKKIKGYKRFFGLERMNQTSVEAFLEIKRKDRMNGGLLIPYYFEYEKTGDPECERLLLLHNNDDVKGMIQLAAALSYADMYEGKFTFAGKEAACDTVILEFTLENAVPREVNYEEDGLSICVSENLLQINIRENEGEARIPVRNYQDYFYLPAEDKIIHKDVAAFVDKKFRKKATAKNCYLKKMGVYVPSFGMDSSEDEQARICKTSYMFPDERGRMQPYLPAADILEASAGVLESYAAHILQGILTKKPSKK